MTQQAKHTPGPVREWMYIEPDNWYGTAALVCTKDKSEPICQIPLAGWGKRQGRQIGAVIASAPALRAALERVAAFPCNCPTDKLPGDDCESCIARKAIAGAKGK